MSDDNEKPEMSRFALKLREQSEKTGIQQVTIASILGISPQAVNNLFNGRANSTAHWREIAVLLQIPEDEMQALMAEAGRKDIRGAKRLAIRLNLNKENNQTWMAAQSADTRPTPNATIDKELPMVRPGRMLPVLGEAVGGDGGEYIFNGQVLDYVACPPSLVNVPNAYCVYVDGESMAPRFKPGETVFVHPGKPPRRGDDVIVQIKPDVEDTAPRGFIKEFVGWTESQLILTQHNPVQPVKFEREEVMSVHPIILSGKYN